MDATLPLASGIPVHCAHHAIVPLHELKPHPANPNKHPERQLTLYAQAIRQHGWREAITVSRLSGFVISGHGAIEAARRIPADAAPVEYQDYDSAAAELADLLTHNRLPALAVTEKDLLKAALLQVGGADAQLVTGYTAEDISALIEQAAPLPQFPITAKLNERHDYVLIYCDSETDFQFLKNLLGVRIERSFKNTTVGEGRVVPFTRALQSLRENLHSIPPARGHDDHASSP